MLEVLRHDTFELIPASRTPEGYLVCEATAAAAGVLTYMNRDGSTRRELVLPETLKNPETLGSMALKPVTIEHPKSQDGKPVLVNVDNIGKFGVGKVYEVGYLDGHVKIRMVIDSKEAIARIDSDEDFRGTSPAYMAKLDETPGVHPKYGRYDAIQVARSNNHFALTKAPRGGFDAASFRVDSMPSDAGIMVPLGYHQDGPQWVPSKQTLDSYKTESKPSGALLMSQIQIDGLSIEVADAATASHINNWRKDQEEEKAEMAEELRKAKELIEGFTAKISEKDTAIDAMTEERDGLKGQLDTLKASMGGDSGHPENEGGEGGEGNGDGDGPQGDSAEDRVKWFNERTKLAGFATQLKIDSVDELSNPDLKRKIVEAYRGDALKDATDGEINGAFLMVEELLQNRRTGIRNIENKRNQPAHRTDAIQDYEDKMLNAWKGKKSA